MKIVYAGFNKDMETELDALLEEYAWIRGASGFSPTTQQRDIAYEQLCHSCKTCQHERYSEDGNDSYNAVVPLHFVRGCAAGEQARIDAIWERLSEATPDNRLLQNGVHIPPVVDCPGWVRR